MRTRTRRGKNFGPWCNLSQLICIAILCCTCNTPDQKILNAHLQAESIRNLIYPKTNFPPVLTHTLIDSISTSLEDIQTVLLDARNQLQSEEAGNALIKTDKIIRQISFMVVQAHQNPAFYRLGTYLDHVPPASENTLESLHDLLKVAKPFYDSAKENLKYPNPQQCLLAVELHRQDLEYFKKELPMIIAQAPGGEVFRKSVLQDLKYCELIIKDYIAFCRSKNLNHLDSLQNS